MTPKAFRAERIKWVMKKIGKIWSVHIEEFNKAERTLVSILRPRWPRTQVEKYVHQKFVDDYLGLADKIEMKKHGKLFPDLRQDTGVNGDLVQIWCSQTNKMMIAIRCQQASISGGKLDIAYSIYEGTIRKERRMEINLPNDARWK